MASRPFEVYRQIAEAAQGERAVEELLAEISRIVGDGFDFDRVAISRYDSETERLTRVAASGVSHELVEAAPASLDHYPLHRQAMAQGALVFVPDVRSCPHIPVDLIARFGVTSALVLPLMSHGRCLGFVSADRDGARFELDDDAQAELDAAGVLIATLVEKALLHDEMRQLDELKDHFIALAAHELKTPVSVIYGITATLHDRDSLLDESQRVELRATLHSQSARLKQLVDQLLDVSRLEAGAVRIQPERVRVRRRIEELVLLLAEKRAHEVEIDVPPELEAEIDPVALDRVVSNLVGNALRYGAPPVEVRAEQRDRHFRLTVVDHGPGVSADVAPRLFDRFSRGRVGEGSGLGLAIAREYARAHGGDLLYDPSESSGARFELVVPSRR